MNVMITGAHGLLGQKLALVIARESDAELLLTDLASDSFFDNPRFDYAQLDITRVADVKSLVRSYQPDVIINAAAMTDVDRCEIEREQAWRLNVDAVKNILIAARSFDTHIVQISTDYVFDGAEGNYTEKSRPNPQSYYGKSKLAAENAILSSGLKSTIVRTQVLYGTGYHVRQNFVSWVLAMLERKQPFRVVTDQVGNPTLADDLAYGILRIAEKRATGIYHVCGSEVVDRFRFAQEVAQIFDFDKNLISPTTTSEIKQEAPRPKNSSFITLKFESEFFFKLSRCSAGLQVLRQQYRDGANHVNLLKAL